MEKINILDQQPTQEKPYSVDNYPYGFRLRTQIRYWIETTKRGQRFVSQTLNPKTQQWNKPKKCIYYNIILVGLNDNDHVTYTCLDCYSMDAVLNFEKYKPFFSEHQAKEYKSILGILKIYDKVEYKTNVRKYKHKITGEIVESIPRMQMSQYVEVDDNGNIVDHEKEERERKKTNIRVNKAAVSSAMNEGVSCDDAISTLNRL